VIAAARARMRSALGQEAAVPGGGCPVGGGATAPAEAEASPAAPGGCPMSGRAAAPPAEPEARVRLGGLNEVTAGFVESLGKKLGYGEVEAAGSAMPWTEAARERLARVPDTVRGEVMQAVEGNARAAGATQVDIDALDAMAGPSGERGDCHQGPSGFGAPDSGRP
jgi:Proto-chlorophyllide reductase 57 kD subunit